MIEKAFMHRKEYGTT